MFVSLNRVKKELLPTIQSLCQDVNNDVRACICLQLRYVAGSLDDDVMKLLPSLVGLASDEDSNVRQAAIQAIGHLLPRIKPGMCDKRRISIAVLLQ